MTQHPSSDNPEQQGPFRAVISVDRGMLMNVAYRLLGSTADAEDVVQETYVRWYSLAPQQRDAIDSPAAWFVRVATRICLDTLNSARRRREHYIGEWIPEPLPERGGSVAATSTSVDPADRITLDESITMAVLVVLESMTPAERVSFVLHDVFQYSFREISEIVGRSDAACRQLATSARRRVATSRARQARGQQHAELVSHFKAAFESGDAQSLIRLLDPQATAIADGGGQVRSALHPIQGGAKVARFLVGLRRRAPALDIAIVKVNAEPGVAVRLYGSLVAVVAMHARDGRVHKLWIVQNPDKLRRSDAHPE